MAKILKATSMEIDVYTAAIQRIEECFKRFDTIEVLFSGGKDSTVVLNLALEVARKMNKLPLRACFWDEEALHPPTVEYMERIAANPEIKLTWYCLEIKHRNACSNESPYWFCWDKTKKDLWVREFPKTGIADHPRFKKGMSIPDFNPFMPEKQEGTVCHLMGIRAQESMRRRNIVLQKQDDNWLSFSYAKQNLWRAFPIYDWLTDDVWVAPGKFGWDYNKTYDIFEMAGLSQHKQRVCPPYGEEPLRGLHLYAECWPELWHKMIARVHGATTAARYANTELYSYGTIEKPIHMTWKEHMENVIMMYPIQIANEIRTSINGCITQHHKKSKLQITEETPDPVSGICWQWLCKLAIKGDTKGRGKQLAILQAEKQNKKNKVDSRKMIEQYGKLDVVFNTQKKTNEL